MRGWVAKPQARHFDLSQNGEAAGLPVAKIKLFMRPHAQRWGIFVPNSFKIKELDVKSLIRITIAVIGIMFLTGAGTLANINESNITITVQDNVNICTGDRCKVVKISRDNAINEVAKSTNTPYAVINTQ